MARLYDRIMAEPERIVFGPEADHPETGLNAELMLAMRRRGWWDNATVLDAREPAEVFLASERHIWDPADFPNAAPPLERLFIEVPLQMQFFRSLPTSTRWGVLYQNAAPVGEPDDPIRWFCAATVVCEVGPKVVPVLFGPVDIAPDGRIVTDPEKTDRDQWGLRSCYNPDGEMGPMVEAGMLVFGAALFAISLMHCKNVERRAVTPPFMERDTWKRKHRRPLVRYHVLDIDPMRKVLRDEGGSETHGLKKALHICRGHFATYTEDAPLFGRLTGTFWKPQHVRGSAKSGAVVKDYRVKAPRA